MIAGILTVATMIYIANRMQARPNRVQTAVELLFTTMRDNITRGNMEPRMASKWFPFLGALFLFIWYSNLIGYIPLPTNSQEKFDLFGAKIPAFALYAATANVSVPLVLALVVPALRTYFGLTRPAVIVYETSIPLLVVWFLTLTAAYRFRVMDRLLGLPDLVGDRSAHEDHLPS